MSTGRGDHTGGHNTHHQRALRQLRDIAADPELPLLEVTRLPTKDGRLHVRLLLDTRDIPREPGGLPLSPISEEFTAEFSSIFPLVPPTVHVAHDRFVGHPHVLQGNRLCLYLEPLQQWHPDDDVRVVLDRLWTWLCDAAADAFDRSTALFHPVGGVEHAHPGTPLVVVRQDVQPGLGPLQRRWLHQRSPDRLDLLDKQAGDGDAEALVVHLRGPLQYGAGTTVGDLLSQLQRQAHPRLDDILTVAAQVSARNEECTPLHLILAVPSRAGGPASERRHLICARLPAAAVQRLRRAAVRQGLLLRANPELIDTTLRIEWIRMSDERSSVTFRRDTTRPTAPLLGRRVIVWGCGGLGSWIAELLVRAGVATIDVYDYASVTGGLLVRQDYREHDVGRNKAESLAAHLRGISDSVVVTPHDALVPDGGSGLLPPVDLIVDATISTIGVTLTSRVWEACAPGTVFARVATDRASATLGLLVVSTTGHGPDPAELDQRAGALVATDSSLEPFRGLWTPALPGEEMTPEPGCSTPTFHGSAADMAALAGSVVSFAGLHLEANGHGVHLFGLPHSLAPRHEWLDAGRLEAVSTPQSDTQGQMM